MHRLNYLMGDKEYLITDYDAPAFGSSVVCGHCGVNNAPFLVLQEFNKSYSPKRLLVCSNCGNPIADTGYELFPGEKVGRKIEGLSDNIKKAYDEARECYSVNAFLGTVLICRKILMHIAVEKGAPESQSFVIYIDYLVEKGIITLSMREWVDEIRNNGNIATHQIENVNNDVALDTLNFTIQLLTIVYEMAFLANKRKATKK